MEIERARQLLMNGAAYEDEPGFAEEQYEALKLADEALQLMQKREQGLVVELPCKVGDVVYEIKGGCKKKPGEYVTCFPKPCTRNNGDNCEHYTKHDIAEATHLTKSVHQIAGWYLAGRLGKTVFLTRADAEGVVNRG